VAGVGLGADSWLGRTSRKSTIPITVVAPIAITGQRLERAAAISTSSSAVDSTSPVAREKVVLD